MEKFIPDPARLQAVEENWKRVLDRVQEGAVKSGRDPREVRLMAVTRPWSRCTLTGRWIWAPI